MITKGHIYKIVSTSETFGRLILHAGIMFSQDDQYYVIHKTFDGIEITPLTQYLANRTEINCQEYQLKQDIDISQIYYAYKDDKFNFINNNCENFVNDFINNYTTSSVSRTSQQVKAWSCMLLMITIACAIIISRNAYK